MDLVEHFILGSINLVLLNILEIFYIQCFFPGIFFFPSRAIQLQVNNVNFPCECPLLSDIYLAKIYCVIQESLKVYITEYIIKLGYVYEYLC